MGNMVTSEILRCTRCVMDATDVDIQFDEAGVCNYCHEFEQVTSKQWFPNDEGRAMLEKTLNAIKAEGKGKEYDCILGLSGGLDSSYLAIKMHEFGLRPLVFHIDAGWNSELAVANIENIVKHCNYDLHTHVVDWEEMRDLHLAYLRAGVANQDVPQDHVFFSTLYHYAVKSGVRYIMSGCNIATESVPIPKSWQGTAMDAINLKAIHKKYGERPLKSYRTISFFDYYLWYPYVKRMKVVKPLNFMPYDKADALKELERLVGWKAYDRKHGESIFTKWYQNYYFPTKYGFDKRLPHLSSLINSGQMTREQALAKLQEPLCGSNELEIDIAYICKKLRITRQQFDEIMQAPKHHHTDFPSWKLGNDVLRFASQSVRRLTGKSIKPY